MHNVRKFAHDFALIAGQAQRLDSSQVAYLERQLTAQAETIIADYGPLKAESLAPLNTDTPAWAEQVSYPLLSDQGRARVVADNATDLPIVGITLDDNVVHLVTVGCAFLYNWLESQTPDTVGAINKIGESRRAAVQAIRRELDRIGMVGTPHANLGGLLNNPNVPQFTLPNGDWTNPATTKAEILEDLRAWEEFIILTSGEGGNSGMMYPNILVAPGAEVSRLHDNAGTGTDSSIWSLFTQHQSQGVSEGKVDPGEWELVRSTYATNVLGDRRGIMYHKSPEVLVSENPLPFEERNPQEQGLQILTPVVGRTAGVVWKKPAMGAYGKLD